jgi:hypothetical protein
MAYAWCSPLHIILHLLNIVPKQNTRAKAAPPNCTQNLPHAINLLLMFLDLLSEGISLEQTIVGISAPMSSFLHLNS